MMPHFLSLSLTNEWHAISRPPVFICEWVSCCQKAIIPVIDDKDSNSPVDFSSKWQETREKLPSIEGHLEMTLLLFSETVESATTVSSDSSKDRVNTDRNKEAMMDKQHKQITPMQGERQDEKTRIISHLLLSFECTGCPEGWERERPAFLFFLRVVTFSFIWCRFESFFDARFLHSLSAYEHMLDTYVSFADVFDVLDILLVIDDCVFCFTHPSSSISSSTDSPFFIFVSSSDVSCTCDVRLQSWTSIKIENLHLCFSLTRHLLPLAPIKNFNYLN
jgi:hypothetical protein